MSSLSRNGFNDSNLLFAGIDPVLLSSFMSLLNCCLCTNLHMNFSENSYSFGVNNAIFFSQDVLELFIKRKIYANTRTNFGSLDIKLFKNVDSSLITQMIAACSSNVVLHCTIDVGHLSSSNFNQFEPSHERED